MPSADSEDIVKASEIFCLLWTVVLKNHKYCPNGEFATNQEFMYVPLEPVVNCSIIGIVICSIRGQIILIQSNEPNSDATFPTISFLSVKK